jgi:hypothetical protein
MAYATAPVHLGEENGVALNRLAVRVEELLAG